MTKKYAAEQRGGKWCVVTEDETIGVYATKTAAEAYMRAAKAAESIMNYCNSCGMPEVYSPMGKLFDDILEARENDAYNLISTLNDSISSIINDKALAASDKEAKLTQSMGQFLSALKDRSPQLSAYAAADIALKTYFGKKKKKAGVDYDATKDDHEPDPNDDSEDGADGEIDPVTGKKKKKPMPNGDSPPGMYDLKGVEVFASGTHNGDKYTEKDLDDMVEAFSVQNFVPPLKAGHDETPGRPALGWVSNLRRVGEKLVADFTHLPKDVYELIKRRGYDRVSSEVYWNLKSAGKTFRRALKAVALLGADVPAVTTLAPLHTLFSGLTGEVKIYGGTEMATTEKEALAALAKQVGDLQSAITGGGSNGGAGPDPEVVKSLSALADQVRVLDKRINETAQAEQRNMQLSEELEKYQARVLALEEDQRRGRISKVIEEVKIPAFRPYFEALLDVATKDSRVVKFTKRDGKSEDMTIERVVKAFIQELNESARRLFSETSQATGNYHTRLGDDIDLENRQEVSNYVDRKTREYMATKSIKVYADALALVLGADPELKTAYAS